MTPYEYGRAAFERGIRCAPAMDAEFLATRAGLPISSHRDGAYDEWLRGWTDANLAAPVATAPTTAPEYQAFVAADKAWSAELERIFGKRAGDARYIAEGRTGSILSPLHAEFARARDAWHAKMNEQAAPSSTAHLTTCPRCGHPAQHEETPSGEGYITCGHCAALTFDRTADDEPASEFYAAAQAPTPKPYIHINADVNGGEYAREREAAARAAAPTPAPLSPVEALRLALERGVFGLDTKARLMAALEAADEEALMNAELLTRARESVAVNLEMRKIEAAIFDLPC